MLKVAILDDGVYEDRQLLSQPMEHYVCCDSGVFLISEISDGCGEGQYSHGTFCAYAMTKICPNIKIIDLKVLKETTSGSIECLVGALEWCCEQNISIVNMSLGSCNYYDMKRAHQVIDKLINQGAHIVAAVNNTGLQSFPATYPGVFGVRNDEGSELINGQYKIDYCKGFAIENCFVAHMDEKVITSFGSLIDISNGNSFAAPVIAGHIANCILAYPQAERIDVGEYLLNNCSCGEVKCKKIQKYLSFEHGSVESMVVEIEETNYILLQEIKEMFSRDLYYAECFADGNEEGKVPLSYYCDEFEPLNRNMLLTWDRYYDADIMLICRSAFRKSHLDYWNDIDFRVEYTNSKYILLGDKLYKSFVTKSELYGAIKNICNVG